MHRVRLEMAMDVDLHRPLEVSVLAKEAMAGADASEREALLLFASAVVEEAAPGLVLNLAKAVRLRLERVAAGG